MNLNWWEWPALVTWVILGIAGVAGIVHAIYIDWRNVLPNLLFIVVLCYGLYCVAWGFWKMGL